MTRARPHSARGLRRPTSEYRPRPRVSLAGGDSRFAESPVHRLHADIEGILGRDFALDNEKRWSRPVRLTIFLAMGAIPWALILGALYYLS